MKIVYNKSVKNKKMSLEDFATQHDLTLEVHERDFNKPKYFVFFRNSETKSDSEDICLESTYGNGRTVKEAIKNYAKKLSKRLLVLNASYNNRKEIEVPILFYEEKTK